MSIVLLLGIIPTLAMLDTGTTGGGDTVCVCSDVADDRPTVASGLVNNWLLLSGDVYVAETEATNINSVAGSP